MKKITVQEIFNMLKDNGVEFYLSRNFFSSDGVHEVEFVINDKYRSFIVNMMDSLKSRLPQKISIIFDFRRNNETDN